jgi:periplasmic protein TonB
MSAVMQADIRQGSTDNRALNYAVLGSLVFHGVLLFGLSLNRESQRAPSLPGPLVARLVAPPAPPAAVAPQPEPPKPRTQEPPPPPVVKPAPVPQPSPIAKAEPMIPSAAPAPVAPAPVAPATETPPPSAPSPAAAVPGPAARTDPQPTSPAPSTEGLDALSIRQYLIDVAGLAKKFKTYPRVARDNNWEGKVVIRVAVKANGINATYSVLVSSGHEVLDKQALEMITKGRSRAQIPPALRGKEFFFDIPVFYEMKEDRDA